MMLRYIGWKEAAELIIQGVADTIAAKEMTYDLARLREAIRATKRDIAARKNVEEDLQRLIPGATLLTCSGFGDAIIKRMRSDRRRALGRARAILQSMTATFRSDCMLCPRLARFLGVIAHENPDYHCKPVAPFGEAAARAADRGAGAGHARREPHRPPVHGRLRGDTLI